MKNTEPWNFCETPKEKCTMNYCDENGCQNRKRNYVEGNDLTADVSHCGLTEIEYTERQRLLELQRNTRRCFSQEEFDRLKELSNKMFANAGSLHSA